MVAVVEADAADCAYVLSRKRWEDSLDREGPLA